MGYQRMLLLGKTVREALDFVIKEITQAVLCGEAVKLTGWDHLRFKRERIVWGQHQGTGESLLIKSRRVVVFRPTRHFWGEGMDRNKPV